MGISEIFGNLVGEDTVYSGRWLPHETPSDVPHPESIWHIRLCAGLSALQVNRQAAIKICIWLMPNIQRRQRRAMGHPQATLRAPNLKPLTPRWVNPYKQTATITMSSRRCQCVYWFFEYDTCKDFLFTGLFLLFFRREGGGLERIKEDAFMLFPIKLFVAGSLLSLLLSSRFSALWVCQKPCMALHCKRY